MAEPNNETLTLTKTLEIPIVESEANPTAPPQPEDNATAGESGGDGEDPREAKPSSISAPATDLEKKVRRAERFGLPVQLSEEEKRTSRAERFGVGAKPIGKNEAGSLEDEKRKARAERFGLTGQPLVDEKEKKKARSERFAANPKPVSEEEEAKRKARTLRFSGASDGVSKGNVKANSELEAAVTDTGGA